MLLSIHQVINTRSNIKETHGLPLSGIVQKNMFSSTVNSMASANNIDMSDMMNIVNCHDHVESRFCYQSRINWVNNRMHRLQKYHGVSRTAAYKTSCNEWADVARERKI